MPTNVPNHPLPAFPTGRPMCFGRVQAMMVAENQCGPAAEAVELFIRQAAVLPRRPAVLIMVASPDQDNCAEGQLGKVVNHNRKYD